MKTTNVYGFDTESVSKPYRENRIAIRFYGTPKCANDTVLIRIPYRIGGDPVLPPYAKPYHSTRFVDIIMIRFLIRIPYRDDDTVFRIE